MKILENLSHLVFISCLEKYSQSEATTTLSHASGKKCNATKCECEIQIQVGNEVKSKDLLSNAIYLNEKNVQQYQLICNVCFLKIYKIANSVLTQDCQTNRKASSNNMNLIVRKSANRLQSENIFNMKKISDNSKFEQRVENKCLARTSTVQHIYTTSFPGCIHCFQW